MCHAKSHKDSFLATGEETPEPRQAFCCTTRIQYFISKGKEESAYGGDNNLEVVYQSLSYNMDLTLLKGCTCRMLNIHSEDLKDKKKRFASGWCDCVAERKRKGRQFRGNYSNNQNNDKENTLLSSLYRAENGWGRQVIRKMHHVCDQISLTINIVF